MTERRPTGHLNDEQAAGYLSRSLSPAQQDHVEGHLADCAECRTAMRANARLLRSARSRAPVYVASSLAAAAVVLVLATNPFRPDATEDGTLRGPVDTENQVIVALDPADGAAVDPSALRFVWNAFAADVRYHVTLTNAQGDEIWTAQTGDTSLTLPADVNLMPDGRYYWYVDALLLDGRAVTTGTQSFEVAR